MYDYAGIFSPKTLSATEAAIRVIRSDTGAQIIVYTQLKPGATTAATEQDAAALLDQWGVGGSVVNDGLVILWNINETLVHGQVQLYAGPGFRVLVTDNQRQAIFDDDMLPLLRKADLNGAMLTAMTRLQALLTLAPRPLATTPATSTAGAESRDAVPRLPMLALACVAFSLSLMWLGSRMRGTGVSQ